jgi:crotonobetainyl-CoA:carnitine CoA-transferase CaiB-like acyl-CoA transferase
METTRQSPKSSEANRPLAGITVIDLGQVYQGPYATFMMAKAGADVIKVEPLTGEAGRSRAEINAGAMVPFEMLNANKRSVTIDLKKEKGRLLLIELVRRADVLVENFAPGVMDRLGVGWKVLHEINPALVYASGTGFGLTGPDRDGLAMDITVQAVSGMMSITGMPDGPPIRTGPAVVDFLAGTHLYAAVMTALVERARTGVGRLVEVAMQEAVFPTLASTLGMMYGKAADAPLRTGNRHAGLAVAPYNVYRAADGYVAIIVVQEVHWHNLLALMEREDLLGDSRFSSNAARVTHMDQTDTLIESWTSQHTMSDLFEWSKARRVPCAPVRQVADVLVDPHMHERGMLQWVDHPRLGRTVLPNSPLRFHGATDVQPVAAPVLGEHNLEVFGNWLGLGSDAVERLRAEGVV